MWEKRGKRPTGNNWLNFLSELQWLRGERLFVEFSLAVGIFYHADLANTEWSVG